jgi:hypothetical protein
VTMNKDDLAAKLAKATLDDMARPMSNKDDVAGLVRDLRTHAYDDCGERDIPTHIGNIAADALTTLSSPSPCFLATIAALPASQKPVR